MIITLCGSAKFESAYVVWNERLTLAGHTVFGLAVYPSQKPGGKNWYSDEVKAKLDAAHLRKIDASEAIVVLNVDAYIGDSTRKEIQYAEAHNKRVYYIHPIQERSKLDGELCI